MEVTEWRADGTIDTKRQGEADGERSAKEAMVEGRDGRTKEGRGGRAARTGREQTAPAGHLEKKTVQFSKAKTPAYALPSH